MIKELEKRFERFPLYSQDGKGDEAIIIFLLVFFVIYVIIFKLILQMNELILPLHIIFRIIIYTL